MWVAMATARSSTSSSSMTWETSPIRSASSASTLRPVRMISLERDVPTARGRSQLTPSSQPVRPLVMPAPQNTAERPARRMSAPRLRHMPPP